MSEISQCENKIQRYRRLKSDVKSVMQKLSLAIKGADSLSIEIGNKYQIDNNPTPILSRTKELKSDMKETYNYLNNKVLPAIKSEIVSLNNKKDRLEQAEKESN